MIALQFRALLPSRSPAGKKVGFMLSREPMNASHIARKQIGLPSFVGFCICMCERGGAREGIGEIRELGKNWVESE